MRLIDADYLREQIQRKSESSYGLTRDVFTLMVKLLDVSDTVDAVEVVRCKDCKNRYRTECSMKYLAEMRLNDTDFCSLGERKTDETD